MHTEKAQVRIANGEPVYIRISIEGKEHLMGLSTVLACVNAARETGELPDYDAEWWESVLCNRTEAENARCSLPVLRATGEMYRRDSCPDGYDPVINQLFFELTDGKEIKYIGITTFIKCLWFAEECGFLPKHDYEWMEHVHDLYDISLLSC